MRAPNDPDYGHHDSRLPPESRLVMAILAQAVQDLFGGLGGLTPTQRRTERHEALSFLTATSGMWSAQRARYCTLVGIDPDVFRARIIAILDGRREPNLPYGFGRGDEGLVEARALWAERSPPRQTGPATRRPTAPAPPPSPLAPSRPPPLPRIVQKVDPRTVEKAKVFALLREPIRQTDILNALEDDMSHHTIMKILNEGIERGEVVRNRDRRYRLATRLYLNHLTPPHSPA